MIEHDGRRILVADHLGVDDARHHDRGADPVVADLGTQRAVEADDRVPGRRVGGAVGGGDLPGGGGDVDDVAAAPRQEAIERQACAGHGAQEVHGDGPLGPLGTLLGERPEEGDAGVVDDGVQRSEPIRDAGRPATELLGQPDRLPLSLDPPFLSRGPPLVIFGPAEPRDADPTDASDGDRR